MADKVVSNDIDSLLSAADKAAARVVLELGNLNNTSDANKPVSTAQQTALDLKANLTLLTAGTSSPHVLDLKLESQVNTDWYGVLDLQDTDFGFKGYNSSDAVLGAYRFDFGNAGFTATFGIDSLSASRVFELPDQAGTFAMVSDLSSYLPLAGGTVTGSTTFQDVVDLTEAEIACDELTVFDFTADAISNLLSVLGISSYADETAANAAEAVNVAYFNVATGKVQITTS